MALPPHEKPLSPYEERVLATLEEEFRVEDPALAAALGGTPPESSTALAVLPPIRHVLLLLAALTGLIAVVALAAGRLGVLGMAVVTCAAVVPWLILTARSAERRSRADATSGAHAAEVARQPVTSSWKALPTAIRYRTLLLAVALFLAALALAPPAWRAVLGVVLWLVVLPSGLLRLWASGKKRGTSA
jgi:hypothetical protein